MKDLSAKIRQLRGELSQAEMAEKCGLGQRTIANLENGDSGKLDTLRKIAKAFKLPEAEWVDMMTAWVKSELGPEAHKLFIEPRNQDAKAHDKESDATKLNMLVHDLNAEERRQLLLLLQRPEVRRVLPSINKLYDALSK